MSPLIGLASNQFAAVVYCEKAVIYNQMAAVVVVYCDLSLSYEEKALVARGIANVNRWGE